MSSESEKYVGYLFKLDQSIIGQSRKKFWFVLPFDAPTLYWFKNASDFQCVGRMSLSGAAFTYNPRENGTFEIHVNNDIIVLEASSNKLRTEWLRMLQMSRKRYYERNLAYSEENKDEKILSEVLKNEKEEMKQKTISNVGTETQKEYTSAKERKTIMNSPKTSTFYLSEDGELNRNSLCLPDESFTLNNENKHTTHHEEASSSSVDASQIAACDYNVSVVNSPTKRIINKARESMRRFSEAKYSGRQSSPKESKCERCIENSEISTQLRNRCFELTDELVANQDLISSLKRSLVTAHNQRDSLAKMCEENATVEDKLDMILEREILLTNLQCNVTELRRDIEYYKEENRSLEAENASLNAMVDAFRESIRTKDELILKFYDDTSTVNTTSEGVIRLNTRGSVEQEVPEAILFDMGAESTDEKRLFMEANVNDVTEMKDLVDGYTNQNKFLNNEVIELQRIVQSLEDRERRLIRQNFDIEAIYYQLKSRYIMVLNHFRLSTHSNRFLDPTLVQTLINEMIRPSSSAIRVNSPNQTPSPSIKSNANVSSSIGVNANAITSVIDPSSYSMLLSPYKNVDFFSLPTTMDVETDSLGFYLNSPRTRCQTPMALMAITRLTPSIATTNNNGGIPQHISSPQERVAAEMSRSISIASETSAEMDIESASPSGIPSIVSSTVDDAKSIDTLPHDSSSGSLAKSSTTAANLNEPTADDWMMRVAAHLKKRADDIHENISLADNRDYIEWLQKWDAFLVNHVLQPLPDPGINSELKSLIRMGISHTYRSRIWRSLVFHYVGSTEAEMGKGYYECLLRKAEKVLEKSSDSALKQIDLDLGRTLPTNKQFDREDSEKVQALKRVLYAYRFHNRVVEYCQGLNRIAAIGLLYLSEADAFWFLVACVEHLQPPNYYNHNLLGAIIDQKILLDLVQKKLPALWEHFRKLDVDLSLFTLNWFLTVFVDALNHNIYINIFDVFLYEGNKVLFRFALALLKMCESRILECTSLTGVQACLSNLSGVNTDYKTLANIAFKQLNPFPAKTIESRRNAYLVQYKV